MKIITNELDIVGSFKNNGQAVKGEKPWTQNVSTNMIFQTAPIAAISTTETSLYRLTLSSTDGATSLSAPNLTSITQNLTVTSNPVLTSVSLPVLATVGSFDLEDTNPGVITSINFGALTTIGGPATITCLAVTSLSLPLLATIGGATLISLFPNATSISLPALTTVSGNLTIDQMAALTTLTLTLLATVSGDLNFDNMQNAVMTTMTFPALTSVGGYFTIGQTNGMTGLTSVDVSALTHVGSGLFFVNCTSLTTITLNSALDSVNLGFTGNALSQASVDDILAKLDTAGNSNGSLALTGGTNSTPSAAGLVSKGNLVGKGWTVTNN